MWLIITGTPYFWSVFSICQEINSLSHSERTDFLLFLVFKYKATANLLVPCTIDQWLYVLLYSFKIASLRRDRSILSGYHVPDLLYLELSPDSWLHNATSWLWKMKICFTSSIIIKSTIFHLKYSFHFLRVLGFVSRHSLIATDSSDQRMTVLQESYICSPISAYRWSQNHKRPVPGIQANYVKVNIALNANGLWFIWCPSL